MEDNLDNSNVEQEQQQEQKAVESTTAKSVLKAKDLESSYLSAIESAAQKETQPDLELPEYEYTDYGDMTDLYQESDSGQTYLDIVKTYTEEGVGGVDYGLIDMNTIPAEYQRYANLYNRKQKIGQRMLEIDEIEDPIAKELEYQKALMDEFGYDILKQYYGADVKNANYWYNQFRQGNYSNPLNNPVVLDDLIERSGQMWRDLNYSNYLTGPLQQTADSISQLSGQDITPDMLESLKPNLAVAFEGTNEQYLELLNAGLIDGMERALVNEDGEMYGYLHENGEVYAVYTEAEYKQATPSQDVFVLRNGDLFLNNKTEAGAAFGNFGRGLVRSVYDIAQFVWAAKGAAQDIVELFGGDKTFDKMSKSYNDMEKIANEAKWIGQDSRIEMDGKRGFGANLYDIGGFAGQIVGAIALAAATSGGSLAGKAGQVVISEVGEKAMKELAEQGIKEVSEAVMKEATEAAMKELAQQGVKEITEETVDVLAKELAERITKEVTEEGLKEAAQQTIHSQFTTGLQSRIAKSLVKTGTYGDDAIRAALNDKGTVRFMSRRLSQFSKGFVNNSKKMQALRFTSRMGGRIHGTWMGNPGKGAATKRTVGHILKSRASFAAIHASKDAMGTYSTIHLETGDGAQAMDVAWKVFALNAASSFLISGAIDDSVGSDWRKVTNGVFKLDTAFQAKMASNTTAKYMMGKFVLRDTLLDTVDNAFTMSVEQAGRASAQEGVEFNFNSIMASMGDMVTNPSTIAMLAMMGKFNADGSRKMYKADAMTLPKITATTVDAKINNKLADVYNKATTAQERNEAAIMSKEWEDVQRKAHADEPNDPLLAQMNAVNEFIMKFDSEGSKTGINDVWQKTLDEAVTEIKNSESELLYKTVKKTTDEIEAAESGFFNDVLFTGLFNTIQARRAGNTGLSRQWSKLSTNIATVLDPNLKSSYRPFTMSVLDALDGKKFDRDRGPLNIPKDLIKPIGKYSDDIKDARGQKNHSKNTINPEWDADYHTFKIPSTEQTPEIKSFISALELFEAVTKHLGGDAEGGMFKMYKTDGNEWVFSVARAGGNEGEVINLLYNTVHDIADLVDVHRGDQRLALDGIKQNILTLLDMNEDISDVRAMEMLVNDFKVMDIDRALTVMELLGMDGKSGSNDLLVLLEGHKAGKAFTNNEANLSYPQKLFLYRKLKSAAAKVQSNQELYAKTNAGAEMLRVFKKLDTSLDTDTEGALSIREITKAFVEKITPENIEDREALVDGILDVYDKEIVNYNTGLEDFMLTNLERDNFSPKIKKALTELLDQSLIRKQALNDIAEARFKSNQDIAELRLMRNEEIDFYRSESFVTEVFNSPAIETDLRLFYDNWTTVSHRGNIIPLQGVPGEVDVRSGAQLREYVNSRYMTALRDVDEAEQILLAHPTTQQILDRMVGRNFNKETATPEERQRYSDALKLAENIKVGTDEDGRPISILGSLQADYYDSKHFLKFANGFINGLRQEVIDQEISNFKDTANQIKESYFVDTETDLYKAVAAGTKPQDEFGNLFEDDIQFKQVFSLSDNKKYVRVNKELFNRLVYNKLGSRETRRNNMLNQMDDVVNYFSKGVSDIQLEKRVFVIDYGQVLPHVVSEYLNYRHNNIITRQDNNSVNVGDIAHKFLQDYNTKNKEANMDTTRFKRALTNYNKLLDAEKYTPVKTFYSVKDFEEALKELGYNPLEFKYGSKVRGIDLYRDTATVLTNGVGTEVKVKLETSTELGLDIRTIEPVKDSSVMEVMLNTLLDGHDYIDGDTELSGGVLYRGSVDASTKLPVESLIRSYETFMSKLGKVAGDSETNTKIYGDTEGYRHNINTDEVYYNYFKTVIGELSKDSSKQLVSYIPEEDAIRLNADDKFPYKVAPTPISVLEDGKAVKYRAIHSLDIKKAEALLDSGSFDIRYIIPAYSKLEMVETAAAIKPILNFNDQLVNYSNSSLLSFIDSISSPLNVGESYAIKELLNTGETTIRVSKFDEKEYRNILTPQTPRQLNNEVLNRVIELVDAKFKAIEEYTGIILTRESKMILSDQRLRAMLLDEASTSKKAWDEIKRTATTGQEPVKFDSQIAVRNSSDSSESSDAYITGRLSNGYTKEYTYTQSEFESNFEIAKQVVDTMREVPQSKIVKSYTPTPASKLLSLLVPVTDTEYSVPLKNIQYMDEAMLALLPKGTQEIIRKKQSELSAISSKDVIFMEGFTDTAKLGDSRAPTHELGRTAISPTQDKKILEMMRTREAYRNAAMSDPNRDVQLSDINKSEIKDLYTQVMYRDVKKNAQASNQGSLLFVNEHNRYLVNKSMFDYLTIYKSLQTVGVPKDALISMVGDIMSNSTGVKYQSIHNKYYAIDTATGKIVNRYNYNAGYSTDKDIGFLKVLEDYPTVESLENIKIVQIGKDISEGDDSIKMTEIKLLETVNGKEVFNASRRDMEDYFLTMVMGRAESEQVRGTFTNARDALISRNPNSYLSRYHIAKAFNSFQDPISIIRGSMNGVLTELGVSEVKAEAYVQKVMSKALGNIDGDNNYGNAHKEFARRLLNSIDQGDMSNEYEYSLKTQKNISDREFVAALLDEVKFDELDYRDRSEIRSISEEIRKVSDKTIERIGVNHKDTFDKFVFGYSELKYGERAGTNLFNVTPSKEVVDGFLDYLDTNNINRAEAFRYVSQQLVTKVSKTNPIFNFYAGSLSVEDLVYRAEYGDSVLLKTAIQNPSDTVKTIGDLKGKRVALLDLEAGNDANGTSVITQVAIGKGRMGDGYEINMRDSDVASYIINRNGEGIVANSKDIIAKLGSSYESVLRKSEGTEALSKSDKMLASQLDLRPILDELRNQGYVIITKRGNQYDLPKLAQDVYGQRVDEIFKNPLLDVDDGKLPIHKSDAGDEKLENITFKEETHAKYPRLAEASKEDAAHDALNDITKTAALVTERIDDLRNESRATAGLGLMLVDLKNTLGMDSVPRNLGLNEFRSRLQHTKMIDPDTLAQTMARFTRLIHGYKDSVDRKNQYKRASSYLYNFSRGFYSKAGADSLSKGGGDSYLKLLNVLKMNGTDSEAFNSKAADLLKAVKENYIPKEDAGFVTNQQAIDALLNPRTYEDPQFFEAIKDVSDTLLNPEIVKTAEPYLIPFGGDTKAMRSNILLSKNYRRIDAKGLLDNSFLDIETEAFLNKQLFTEVLQRSGTTDVNDEATYRITNVGIDKAFYEIFRDGVKLPRTHGAKVDGLYGFLLDGTATVDNRLDVGSARLGKEAYKKLTGQDYVPTLDASGKVLPEYYLAQRFPNDRDAAYVPVKLIVDEMDTTNVSSFAMHPMTVKMMNGDFDGDKAQLLKLGNNTSEEVELLSVVHDTIFKPMGKVDSIVTKAQELMKDSPINDYHAEALRFVMEKFDALEDGELLAKENVYKEFTDRYNEGNGLVENDILDKVHELHKKDIEKLFNSILAYEVGDSLSIVRDPNFVMEGTRLSMKGRDLSDVTKANLIANNLLKLIKGKESDSMTGSYQLRSHGGSDATLTYRSISDAPQRSLSYDDMTERILSEANILYPDDLKNLVKDEFEVYDDEFTPYDILRKAEMWSARQQQNDGELNKRYMDSVSKLSGTTMLDDYVSANNIVNRLTTKFEGMINNEASLINRNHSDVNMPIAEQIAMFSSVIEGKLYDPSREYDFDDFDEADMWTVALVPREVSENTGIVPTNSTKTLKNYEIIYADKPNAFRSVKLGEFDNNRITKNVSAGSINKGMIEEISPDGRYIIISESIPMKDMSDAKIASKSSYFKQTLVPQKDFEARTVDGDDIDLVVGMKDIAGLSKTGPEDLKQYMKIIGEKEVVVNGETMTVPLVKLNMGIVEYMHNNKNHNKDVSRGSLDQKLSGSTIDWQGYLSGERSLLGPLFGDSVYNPIYDEVKISHPELVKKYISRQTNNTYYNRNFAYFGRAYRVLNIMNLLTDAEFNSVFDGDISKQEYARNLITNTSEKSLVKGSYYDTIERRLLAAVGVTDEAGAVEALLNRVDAGEKKEYLTNLFSPEIRDALLGSKLPLNVTKSFDELPDQFHKKRVPEVLIDQDASIRGNVVSSAQDSLRNQSGIGSKLDTNVPATWFFNKVTGNNKTVRETVDMARNNIMGHIGQDAEIGGFADRFEAVEPMFRSTSRPTVEATRDGGKTGLLAGDVFLRSNEGSRATQLDAYYHNGEATNIKGARYKKPSSSYGSQGENLRYLARLVQGLRDEDGSITRNQASEANSIFYRGLDDKAVEPMLDTTLSSRDYRVENGELKFDVKVNKELMNLRDVGKLKGKGAEFYRGVDDVSKTSAQSRQTGFQTTERLTEGAANTYASEYPSLFIRPETEIDLKDFDYKYETASLGWEQEIRELYRKAFMPTADQDLEPGRVEQRGNPYKVSSNVGDGRNTQAKFSKSLFNYLGIKLKGTDGYAIVRATHHLVTNAQALGIKLNRKVHAMKDAVGNNVGFNNYFKYKHLANQLALGHTKADILEHYKGILPKEMVEGNPDVVFAEMESYMRQYRNKAENNHAISMYEQHSREVIGMAQEVTNINPLELELLMMYPIAMEATDSPIKVSANGRPIENFTSLLDPTKFSKFGESKVSQRIIDDPFEGLLSVNKAIADMLSIKNFNKVAVDRGFAESDTTMKAAFKYVEEIQDRIPSHEKVSWMSDLRNWVSENPLYNKFLKVALDDAPTLKISDVVKSLLSQRKEVEARIRSLYDIDGEIDERVLTSIAAQSQDQLLKDAINDYHKVESARLSIVSSFVQRVTHYGDESLYTRLSKQNDGLEITDGALRKVNPRQPRAQLFGRDIYTLKHEVFNKLQGAKGHEIAFLMDALAGNVFLTNKHLADTLEAKVYTSVAPEGFKKFLSVISSQFSKLIMGNPIRFMERGLGRFAFFDLTMLVGQNPKTVSFLGKAAKEMRQRQQSKGRASTPELEEYFKYKGPDALQVKDYDYVDRAKRGYSLPIIGKVNESVLEGIEWMSDIVRYANFIANVKDIEQGKFKYGNTYKQKEYMDSITDKYEKSYEALSRALPTPGDLPDLAKRLSPHFVFTSFGLGLARSGADWVSSGYRAADDFIRRGDTSGLYSSLLIPGASMAGIAAMSTLMYYLIAEAYGVDDEERDEWIKSQATIDPFATAIFGNPVARPTWNPVTSFYNDWLEPFKVGYEGDPYTKDDDSILNAIFGGTVLNQASKLNPVYKIVPESALGKDLFGAQITDTKHQYNFLENLARKSFGAAIGNTAMNSFVKNMQLSDSTDKTFIEDVARGLGTAVGDEFGNSRQYKQDVKDYYNARNLIYDHIYSQTTEPLEESDLDVWDYSNNYSSQLDEDRTAILKTEIRNAMKRNDSPSIIYNLIYQAIEDGMPDQEIRYVLNQVTISGVLSKVDDVDTFMDRLSDREYKLLNNALAYEARVFPMLARNINFTDLTKLNSGFQVPFGNGLGVDE